MSDNIKVVVKVRPLIPREIEEKLSYQWRVINNTLHQIDPGGTESKISFTFDKVYDESTNTKDVFNDIAKPIVEAAIAGINGTIFAYGQTSSGKTYTMSGTDHNPGIITLAVHTLFNMIQSRDDRDFLLRVSYIEIYNETIKDLLDVTKQQIKIHEGHQGVKIDATETVTSSPEEVLDIMKTGEANRQIGATNMNELSSRSHTIFQITIESREHSDCGTPSDGCVNVSTLNLVDLAGSERARHSGATGQRLKEGTFINKSLSTLALVIKQLSDDPNRFANYRDSKLTQILRNSLGGNAKTSIICAVTLAAVEETISTLQFANRAKAIKNKPEVNAVATNATMIQKLTKELSKLQSQLEVKKTVEQDNQKLKKHISSLQRQIINGFGQRSAMLAPERSERRQTWCAPLHTIEEDRAPPQQRFCTPALKYNPGTISMFLPTPGGLMPRVSEERGLVTPPPPLDNLNEDDSEVITIMSSPDTPLVDELCSPYHKCFEASKTPPCVLREKAKKAEKNLKDIEELTEREKIYTPSVEELLQKLEQKNCVINQLEDEMMNLQKMCHDRGAEIDLLNNKLVKTEEELNTSNALMNDLNATLQKTIIQLTDLEVSFDTLKMKASTREGELLSLLEEKNTEVLKFSSKPMTRIVDKDLHNFMDLSKDISLVNSDTETSTNDDESSSNIQELMNELQNKLSSKTMMVIELEAKLQNEKDINIELQSSSERMEIFIAGLKENLNTVISDNTELKTKVEQLKATIVSLENSAKNLESYRTSVQDIQSKLIENKHCFDDNFIEEMISNEENLIANNENLRNIVLSFKRNIHVRNEEINRLKDLNKLEIDNKTQQVIKLSKEVDELKEQLEKKQEEIIRLTEITVTNEDFATQVLTLNTQNSVLEEINQNYLEQIRHLNEENLALISKREQYLKLQEEVSLQNKCYQEYISKLRSMTIRVQNMVLKMNSNVEDSHIPEEIGYPLILEILNNYTIILEKAISVILNNETDLRNELKNFSEKYRNHVSEYQTKIDSLTVANENDLKLLENQNKNLATAISNIRKELEEQEKINDECNKKLCDSIDGYDKLREIVLDKEILISDLQEKQSEYLTEIEELKEFLQQSKQAFNAVKEEIQAENNKFLNNTNKELNQNLKNISLQEHHSEIFKHSQIISENATHKEKILKTILSKVIDLIQMLNIDNDISKLDSETYDLIPELLDSMAVQINSLTKNTIDNNGIRLSTALNEAKQQIQNLTDENIKLSNAVSQFNLYNKKCVDELEAINVENKSITSSLIECNELLTSLQHETALKVATLNTLEMNTRKFKNNLMNMELAKKEQNLKFDENELLNDQLHLNKEDDAVLYDEHDDNSINKITFNKNRSSETFELPVLKVPNSLISICCKTIMDVLSTNQESCSSVTTSSQTTIDEDNQTGIHYELKQIREENNNLKKSLEFLKSANKQLIEEQETARKEVSLLVEPAMDLQKKITKHRTNLSTLTATTYAENKALQSQVKDLLHNHSRLHNVCQKDMQQYKKSLLELYYILKTETAIKRFSLPDVLDKNNSTLDGDLLMLDTNVTLTTSTDHTLVGSDHSCLDMTQVYLDNDPSMAGNQTLEQSQLSTSLISHGKTSQSIHDDNNKIIETLAKNDNYDTASVQNHRERNVCESCKDKIQIILERNDLSDQLTTIKKQKAGLEEKNYNNLQIDTPLVESLSRKIASLEKVCNTKDVKITELTNALSKEKRDLKQIQEENDTLSSQIMEAITEDDILKKEMDHLKDVNQKLKEKCNQLEAQISEVKMSDTYAQCNAIEKVCKQLYDSESLNRSHDIDTSLRHNKICTLQNELHASKEDCRKITEEVVTIKNQLERSNLSMTQNMDDSLAESNIFSFTLDFDGETETSGSQMPNISEEKTSDIYLLDKQDCFDFFIKNSFTEKENFNQNLKIIDVMKMFHNNLIIKHGNEVENLTNKLKDFEESNSQLKIQINHISTEYAKYCKGLKDTVSSVQNNLDELKEFLLNITDNDKNVKLVAMFNENILSKFDKEFSINLTSIFESLINSIVTKHQNELSTSMVQYTKLHEHMEIMKPELVKINEDLILMKTQLSDKENEYNQLKKQKEQIQEISSVVTLDLIKKEQELREFITHAYQMLLDNSSIEPIHDIFSQSPIDSVKMLFENIMTKRRQDINLETELKEKIESLISEVFKCKSIIEEKEKELIAIRLQNKNIEEINKSIAADLINKDNELLKQAKLEEELQQLLVERKQYVELLENTKQEIDILKNTVSVKEQLIYGLSCKLNDQHKIEELLQKIERHEKELSELKRVNEVITKENETYSIELKMAGDSIQAKNKELTEVVKQTQSVKCVVDKESAQYKTLKAEIDTLTKQVEEARLKYEGKCKECSRLEINIKTHEKSVEIQSTMVKRLQQQKIEDHKRIEELSEKCTDLQSELHALQSIQASTQDTVISLQRLKNTLEVRITDLETELKSAQKQRPSLDEFGANSRRRRQSLHDSKNLFAGDKPECDDSHKMEAMFASRSKPSDLFMDVDEGSSNRSTPSRNNSGRRRDSLFAHSDQSDKEQESRPSSVAATRRRRQSIHDMHRSVLHSPSHSPRDSLLASRLQEELEKCEDKLSDNSDVAVLKASLSSCRQELEELRDRYKELDEECETCAEYLRERDEQCLRLKKEKVTLEEIVAELKKSLETRMNQPSGDSSKCTYSNAAVNTDEDWANLHSVVVDRMSFDAEVEKNKKLTKAIEEFRLKNRDLKATIGRMQTALEKYAAKDGSAVAKELEIAKKDLKSCQHELEELKQRYRELDEECETCAEYLRERDEQCKQLKEAKTALEAKLEELELEKASAAAQVPRKKRQSLHDQNRELNSEVVDATTETSQDSYHANGDDSSKGEHDVSVENKRLRMLVNSLSHRKSMLEQKLQMMAAPMYVATGSAIVQNQQLSDIMKENHTLKKINAKLVNICKKRSHSQSETNREKGNTTEI